MQTTLVVPNVNTDSDGGLQLIELMPELSDAEKDHETDVVGTVPFVGATISGLDVEYGGQASEGTVLSVLMRVMRHDAATLPVLTAVQLTYVTPRPIVKGRELLQVIELIPTISEAKAV